MEPQMNGILMNLPQMGRCSQHNLRYKALILVLTMPQHFLSLLVSIFLSFKNRTYCMWHTSSAKIWIQKACGGHFIKLAWKHQRFLLVLEACRRVTGPLLGLKLLPSLHPWRLQVIVIYFRQSGLHTSSYPSEGISDIEFGNIHSKQFRLETYNFFQDIQVRNQLHWKHST